MPTQDLTMSVAALSMTSREIAAITGKEHKHVLRDIKTMLASLGIDESTFRLSYKSHQNKELPEHHLPKRETLILTSGYSITHRAAIIDRWLELEGTTQSIPIVKDPALAALSVMIHELDAVKQQQAAQQFQLLAHHDRLEGMNGDTGYVTANGYCRRNKIPAPLRTAAKLGRAASALSRELSIKIGDVPDERFGSVHSYSVDVLDEVIGDVLAEMNPES